MLIFAQPTGAALERLFGAVTELELETRLAGRMFPARNWHQTLCGPYDASEEVMNALFKAGDALEQAQLPAFTLSLNRLRAEEGDRIHWSFFARGRPHAFDDVLAILKDQVTRRGLAPDSGHRPHITISYNAREGLPPLDIAPIDWVIHEFALAERSGTGNEWSYKIIKRWKLVLMPRNSGWQQGSLFS
ncbi:2'-5' RNA ligase family protein [Diaphorobacter sp. HDW4A]|uniref:2'-5' RNA ligase family protein n=1 Tax=Diaphorobacter sp. HDW4A TaxID=2714924 RepID=UPI00140A9A54|nr:2'-5' RNA ligase family protein [Diaphorobacter sp. HDW4A]QIL80403.1 2'-5' RNA ligase family protein [Diaphorobacter sp. HDW4A]